jgi:hypothetical protein
LGRLGGTDPMTRKSTVHAIGNTTTATAQAPTPVHGTGWPATRGHHTDDPHTNAAAAAPTTDAATTAGDPTVATTRSSAPYPWDRNRDGWVDDPSRFLEHAEQQRAALVAEARAAAARQQEARATDATTTAGAAATSTRADASGRAHAAVALANATAVVSRASYAHEPAPSRRPADRSHAVREVGGAGGSSGPDVRRHYRPAHPVPAVASRYL